MIEPRELVNHMSGPQLEFLTLEQRFPLLVGGMGSGKTEGLIKWLLAHKLRWPQLNYGYYAPTFDLIRLIAWPRIQEVLDEWGLPYTLNKNEHILHVHGFGQIYFRSLNKPETIVGYEHADAVVDELDTLQKKRLKKRGAKLLHAIGKRNYTMGLRNRTVLRSEQRQKGFALPMIGGVNVAAVSIN